MSIDPSKPVRLVQRPEMIGEVTSVGPDAIAISFVGGGTGRFKSDDVEQHDGPMPEDKSWPPRNLERK
jgi:hypothetical protein